MEGCIYAWMHGRNDFGICLMCYELLIPVMHCMKVREPRMPLNKSVQVCSAQNLGWRAQHKFWNLRTIETGIPTSTASGHVCSSLTWTDR